MKKNGLFKHYFIVGSGTLLSLIISVITIPIITRLVSPEIYGEISIFELYSSIFVLVFGLGLDQSLVRFYYKKGNDKSTLLYKCLIIPLVSSLIAIIMFLFLLKKKIIDFDFNFNISCLLCIYTFVQLVYRFSILIVRLEYKSKLFSLLNILTKIIYASLSLILIVIYRKNYLLYLCLSLTISSIVCLLLSILEQKNIWNIRNINRNDAETKLKELVKYGWPYIFSFGILMVFQSADKICLKMLGTYADVGIYASAMSIVNVFSIIQTTFNSFWSPMSIEHYEENKNDKKFYQDVNQYITVIMFFLGATLIAFKDLIVFALGSQYREAANILPFLIFNPIMYTITETTSQGITFMKKSQSQIPISVICCITNILGNILLIPKFGCKGAAISTGVSYILYFFLMTFVSNKYYYIDYYLKKFVIIVTICLMFALYSTFNQFSLIVPLIYILFLIVLYILYKNYIIRCVLLVKEHFDTMLERKR